VTTGWDYPKFASDGQSSVKVAPGAVIKIPNTNLANGIPSVLHNLPFTGTCYDYGTFFEVYPYTLSWSGNTINVDRFFDFGGAGPGFNISYLGLYSRNPLLTSVPADEDAILRAIGDGAGSSSLGKNITVTAKGTTYAYPRTVFANTNINLTNCARVEGNGPIKVVFAADKSWKNGDPKEILVQAKYIINNGFKEIEPLKSNFDKFSFFVDLYPYSDLPIAIRWGSSNGELHAIYSNEAHQYLIDSNSCAGLSPSQMMFYTGKDGFINGGYVSKKGLMILKDSSFPVTMHEFGHSFANLSDEYHSGIKKSFSEKSNNCSVDPRKDFSYLFRMYGSDKSEQTKGCTFLSTEDENFYYRPSASSIMNDTFDDLRYNVIGCGYILAAINLQTPTKGNAEKYWPNCLKMADNGTVIKTGIPPTNAPPKMSSVSGSSNNFTIAGTGFTTTGNNVVLTYVGPISQRESFLATAIAAFKNVFVRNYSSIAQVTSSPSPTYSSTVSPSTSPSPAPTLSTETDVDLTNSKDLRSPEPSTGFEEIPFEPSPVPLVPPPPPGPPTIGQEYVISDIPSPNGTSLSFVTTSVPPGRYKVSIAAFNSPLTNTSAEIQVTGSTGDAVGDTGGDTYIPPVVPPSLPTTQYQGRLKAPVVRVKNLAFSSATLEISGGSQFIACYPNGMISMADCQRGGLSTLEYAIYESTGNNLGRYLGSVPARAPSSFNLSNLTAGVKSCYMVEPRGTGTVYISGVANTIVANAGQRKKICITPKSAGYILTTLNSPELWTKGSVQPISWAAAGVDGVQATLRLFKNGVADRTIASGLVSGTGGVYDWTVPSDLVSGVRYTIRISGSTYQDASNSYFTVPKQTALTSPQVPSPSSGRVTRRVSSNEILWQPPPEFVGHAGYEILRDGVLIGYTEGSAYIDENAPSDSKYAVRSYTTEGETSVSVPALPSTEPLYDFGGMFGAQYPNPLTGAYSCPSGYTAVKTYGTADRDYAITYCYRTHVAGTNSAYDFGGMFGSYALNGISQTYPNNITGSGTCPTGFTTSRVSGLSGVDYQTNFCHKTGSANPSYEFGGMYGYGDGVTYKNPITGSDTCPAGHSATQVKGTVNVDYRLYYCSKPMKTP